VQPPSILFDLDGSLDPALIERLQQLHIDAYRRLAGRVHPLPGAWELLAGA